MQGRVEVGGGVGRLEMERGGGGWRGGGVGVGWRWNAGSIHVRKHVVSPHCST